MAGVDNLADERKKTQFDVESMKIVWADSREALDISDRMSKLVANDPVISLSVSKFIYLFCVFVDLVFVYLFLCSAH